MASFIRKLGRAMDLFTGDAVKDIPVEDLEMPPVCGDDKTQFDRLADEMDHCTEPLFMGMTRFCLAAASALVAKGPARLLELQNAFLNHGNQVEVIESEEKDMLAAATRYEQGALWLLVKRMAAEGAPCEDKRLVGTVHNAVKKMRRKHFCKVDEAATQRAISRNGGSDVWEPSGELLDVLHKNYDRLSVRQLFNKKFDLLLPTGKDLNYPDFKKKQRALDWKKVVEEERNKVNAFLDNPWKETIHRKICVYANGDKNQFIDMKFGARALSIVLPSVPERVGIIVSHLMEKDAKQKPHVVNPAQAKAILHLCRSLTKQIDGMLLQMFEGSVDKSERDFIDAVAGGKRAYLGLHDDDKDRINRVSEQVKALLSSNDQLSQPLPSERDDENRSVQTDDAQTVITADGMHAAKPARRLLAPGSKKGISFAE